MIRESTKKKFLEELEKNANVYYACAKLDIARATYYRWYNRDPIFRKRANDALAYGRENNTDIGEYALVKKIKEGDLGAIKFLLSHNSSKYQPSIEDPGLVERRKIDKLSENIRQLIDDAAKNPNNFIIPDQTAPQPSSENMEKSFEVSE